MTTAAADPLAPLADLPGVPAAVAAARRQVDRLYGHRVMRRRADEVTAESVLRGARASAALDGADWPLEEIRRRTDFGADAEARRVGGALRVTAESGQLLSSWRHSPLQVLARLHLLAAGEGARSAAGAGGAPADAGVGRPRRAAERPEELFPLALAATEPLEPAAGGAGVAADDAGEAGGAGEAGRTGAAGGIPTAPPAEEVSARLDGLARLLVARVERKSPTTAAPALVAAAVVHGELLTLRPFASHNGVVARAAQRIVLISEGLDPKGICPAEVGLVELGTDAYRRALAGYASGTAEGMAAWIAHCARALELGMRESTAVCEAMQRGMA